RVIPRARPLENVAALVDRAFDIAGLAGNADLMLDFVIVRLELLEPEWPVLDGRAFRQPRRAIAARGLAHDLEVPRIEPPALRPVMQRGAADRIHHRMDGKPRRIGGRCIRPMRWD